MEEFLSFGIHGQNVKVLVFTGRPLKRKSQNSMRLGIVIMNDFLFISWSTFWHSIWTYKVRGFCGHHRQPVQHFNWSGFTLCVGQKPGIRRLTLLINIITQITNYNKYITCTMGSFSQNSEADNGLGICCNRYIIKIKRTWLNNQNSSTHSAGMKHYNTCFFCWGSTT